MNKAVEDLVELIAGTIDGDVYRKPNGDALFVSSDDGSVIAIDYNRVTGEASTSSVNAPEWETGWIA